MPPAPDPQVITPQALLDHWQGHRRLSRRVIAAFPEDQLFTFAIGGLRTFGVLANEMLGMAVPMVRGVVTGNWQAYADAGATTRAELLSRWDASTEELNTLWPQIPLERFEETLTAFGQFTDRLTTLMLYVMDNEIHHRGQGYVYLRALGIEPPPFYVRD